MMRKTSVVIPYYQEKPGILRTAVNSAIAQEGVADLEIIVVDDGSPAPACDDLDGLDLPGHVTLKLIEQLNRGPGAARNRALDEVPPDTVYVAFLDSDDRWNTHHLCNAQHALGQGLDIYFSNAAGYGDILFAGRIDVSRHKCIDEERRLYSFVGNCGPYLLGSASPIHTSTVVYRREKFKDLRFPEIFMMGEDVSFWLQLTKQSNLITFSSQIECFFGEGVHIARNSNWGSPRFIWRTYQAMRWRKWSRNHIDLTAEEESENEIEIEKLRRDFGLGLLHDLRTFTAFTNPYIPRFFICDPTVALYLFPLGVKVALNKMRPQS
jgi:succinoglycan biosynthesis protein ExoW